MCTDMTILNQELKSTITALLKQPVIFKDGNAYFFDRYRIRRSNNLQCHFEFLLKAGWCDPGYESQWLDISINPTSKSTDEYFKNLTKTTLAYAVVIALIMHKKITSQGKLIPLNRTGVVETISLLNGCLDDLAADAAATIYWGIKSYLTDGQLVLIGGSNIVTGYKRISGCDKSKLLAKLIDNQRPGLSILKLLNGVTKDDDTYFFLSPRRIKSLIITSETENILDFILTNIKHVLAKSQSGNVGQIAQNMHVIIEQIAISIYNEILTTPAEADQRRLDFLCNCLIQAMNKEIGCLALILAKHVLESKDCHFETLELILKALCKDGEVLRERHFFIIDFLAKNSSPIIGHQNAQKLDSFIQFADTYKNDPEDIESLILLVFPRFSSKGLIHRSLENIKREDVFFDEYFSLDKATGLPNIVGKIEDGDIGQFCIDFLMRWAVNFSEIDQPCFTADDLSFKDVSKDLVGLAWVEAINEHLIPDYLRAFDTRLNVWVNPYSERSTARLLLPHLNYNAVLEGRAALFLKMNNNLVERFYYIDSKVDTKEDGKLQVSAINTHSTLSINDESEKLCAYLNDIGYFNRLLDAPIIT